MGKLLGLPEWAFATLFVFTSVVFAGALAWRNRKRQIQNTLALRPNLNRVEFLELIAADVSPATAAFIYDHADELLGMFNPRITCHPDDDFIADLPIHAEEWFEFWPAAWAEQQGIAEDSFPDWPENWPTTVRNYGRWLDSARN